MSSPNITRSRQIRHLYEDAQNRKIENSSVRYWTFRMRQLLDPKIWNLVPEQPPMYGEINGVADGRRMDESLECWSSREWYRHGVHEAKKAGASKAEIQTCETQAYIASRDSLKWFDRESIYSYTTVGTTIRFWMYYKDDLYLTPWGPTTAGYIDDNKENFDTITNTFQELLGARVRRTKPASPRPTNVMLPPEWQTYEDSSNLYPQPENDPGVGYQTGSYAAGLSDHSATYTVPYSTQQATTDYYPAQQLTTDYYSAEKSEYYPPGPSTGNQTTAEDVYYPPGPSTGNQTTAEDVYYPPGPSTENQTTAEDVYYPPGPSTGNQSTAGDYSSPYSDQTDTREKQGHSSSKPTPKRLFVTPEKHISKNKKTKGQVTYKFFTSRRPFETEASDWKAGTEGKRKCSVYTDPETQRQYYTWELPK